MLEKVEYAALKRQDWTQVWVSARCKADDFAPDPIFLIGESEGNEGGGLDLCYRGCECVQSCLSDEKLDITDAEWCCVAGAVGVLSWPQKEEEGCRDHVCNGMLPWEVVGICDG